jgi:sarcosine oxidase
VAGCGVARDAEIVVVGAGIMGLATAYELAKRGRDVLVLEQFRVGHTRGSSHGRSRIFRLAYPQAEWVRLAREALEAWRALEAATGETLLELNGLLELNPMSADALAECGVAAEMLNADEVTSRFPVSLPPGSVAMLQPEAGIVYADRAQRVFLAEAQKRGARLLEETRVESLADLEAETVVVTAGAWARPLLAEVGFELGVVPTRETVAYFPLATDRPMPAVAAPVGEQHAFYALPDPPHGLKAGHHRAGPPTDPDREGTVDAAIVRRVAAWAAEHLPLAQREPTAVETCLYTNTADERFVLERHGRYVIGSACSGHAFKFAPVVGARLAELAFPA